jgi:hypothetical protein
MLEDKILVREHKEKRMNLMTGEEEEWLIGDVRLGLQLDI